MTHSRQEAIKKLNKLSTHKKMCLMVELKVWGKEFTLAEGYEACYNYFEGQK